MMNPTDLTFLQPYLLILPILCILLAGGVASTNHNTLLREELSDQDRYYENLTSGDFGDRPLLMVLQPLTLVGKANFPILVNFLLYFSIGCLFWYASHDKLITFVALLCFSTTLLTTFALYAQAIVLIMALAFWIFRPPALYYIGLAILAALGHKFGLVLAGMVFASTKDNSVMLNWFGFRKEILLLLYFGLLVVVGMIFMSVEKMSFFYPTIIPVMLGKLDTLFWFCLFSLLFFTFYHNLRASDLDVMLFTFLIMLGAIANFFFVSRLEVDFWRVCIFLDFIMLLHIAKLRKVAMTTSLSVVPIILALIGAARIVLGLRLL